MSPCKTCSPPLGALDKVAVSFLEYLVRREAPQMNTKVNDVDAVVEGWLIEACEARRHFRELATPVLRSVHRRAAEGLLAGDYERALAFFSKSEKSLKNVVDDVLQFKEVKEIVARSGASPRLIATLQKILEQSKTVIKVKGKTLVLTSPHWTRTIVNDSQTYAELGANSLLSMVSRTWATHGRGLAAPAVSPDGKNEQPNHISWMEGVANTLVQGAWYLDKDVRTLEDLRGLPAIEGKDPISLIFLGIAAVGLIIYLISECIKDSDPELSEILRAVGLALILVGAVGAVSTGVPATVCPTDPYTGVRTCARI